MSESNYSSLRLCISLANEKQWVQEQVMTHYSLEEEPIIDGRAWNAERIIHRNSLSIHNQTATWFITARYGSSCIYRLSIKVNLCQNLFHKCKINNEIYTYMEFVWNLINFLKIHLGTFIGCARKPPTSSCSICAHLKLCTLLWSVFILAL